jgi:hypothetical protein
MLFILAGYIFLVAALKHLSSIGVIIGNEYLILSIVILISATGIASLLIDIKIRLTEIRDAINKKGEGIQI